MFSDSLFPLSSFFSHNTLSQYTKGLWPAYFRRKNAYLHTALLLLFKYIKYIIPLQVNLWRVKSKEENLEVNLLTVSCYQDHGTVFCCSHSVYWNCFNFSSKKVMLFLTPFRCSIMLIYWSICWIKMLTCVIKEMRLW